MRTLLTVAAFAGKEIRQVLRQPRLIVVLIAGPFLILGLFAAGFQATFPTLRTLVVAPPGSPLAPADVTDTDLGRVEVVDVVETPDGARGRLAADEVDLVIVLPEGPVGVDGEQAVVTVLHSRVDPFDTTAVATAARTAVDRLNRTVLGEAIGQVRSESGEVTVAVDDARADTAALDAAIAAGDTAGAEAARGRLADRLGNLEDTIPTGVPTGGDTDARTEVGDLRTDVEALDVTDPTAGERVAAVDERLGLVADSLDTAEAVPTEVILEPFVADVQTVSGIDVPFTIYYTPAVMIVLLQHVIVTFAALSIVNERMLGTTELFRVGPMRPGALLAGKALGYLTVGAVIATLLAVGAVYAFGTPMAGDWAWLGVVLGLVMVASIGLGFVVAATADTDAQAVQYAMLVLLFTIFFGGLLVSVDRLTDTVRYLGLLVPATPATTGLHDVMFRGRPPSTATLAILGGYAVVAMGLARWAFGRRAVA